MINKPKPFIIRTLVSICGGLAFVSLSAIVILTTLINPNRYKPLIVQKVETLTGRKFILGGNISWTIFPKLGLEANNLSLANPKDFPNDNLATLNSAKLSINLSSLLRGDVIIDKLQLNGLTLNLIEKNGRNNWTFSNIADEATSKTETSDKLQWQLNSLQITKANINYQNLTTHQKHKIGNLDLEVNSSGSNIISQTKNENSLKDINFKINDILTGKLNIIHDSNSGNYSGDIQIAKFSLNALLTKLAISKPDIANKELLDIATFSSDFNGNNNALDLKSINATLGASHISGEVNINSLKPLKLEEQLAVDFIDLSDFVASNGFKLPMKQIQIHGQLENKALKDNNFIDNLNANQDLNIQNISVQGVNVAVISAKLGKISGNVIDVHEATQTFNETQTQISHLIAPGPKNLKQNTNLGNLKAEVLIQNGILTTPVFQLSGPILDSSGKGNINLKQKTINYTLYTQLHGSSNSLLSHLIFPYHMSGNLSNFNGSVNPDSVQAQIIKYYTSDVTGAASNVGRSVTKDTSKVIKSSSKFIKNLFN